MRTLINIIILGITLSAAMAEDELTLGILENHPRARIRVAFQKKKNEWIGFNTECSGVSCAETESKKYPKQADWNILFDGKTLGTVTTTLKSWENSTEIGLLDIPNGTKVPKIKDIQKTFQKRWDSKPSDSLRPLVTNNKPYYKDPENWKPKKMAIDSQLLIQATGDGMLSCNCAEYDAPEDCKDIKVKPKVIQVTKAYQSNHKWNLFFLKVDCPEGHDSNKKTYAVGPEGKIERLKDADELLDAGDYDNDGHSELIFTHGGYNSDGYALYYDQFKKEASISWSYH